MSYVLLVEDNQDNADMIIRLLASLELEVKHYIRGLDGARAAYQERPMLILMDFNLPDVDGRTLVLTLKKRLGGPAAPPVIAVTARTGSMEERVAQAFGCDAFVTKPFEPQAFLKLVSDFIAKEAERQSKAR